MKTEEGDGSGKREPALPRILAESSERPETELKPIQERMVFYHSKIRINGTTRAAGGGLPAGQRAS